MNAIVMPTNFNRGLDRLREHAVVLALFASTLFVSALLVFSVQPVFAKMVLPKLGGSPSVWAISMCFFQTVLLAGYCYAYAVNRFVPTRQAPIVHMCLLAVAALALPFGVPADVEPPPGDAYLWLIGVLTLGVGLPFLAVSANAPLLQAWFARTGHPHANDPYFLYGASNLGSLVALLAYPVVLEPVLGLSAQATVWSGGFVLLTALIALCGFSMLLCVLGSSVHGAIEATEKSAHVRLVSSNGVTSHGVASGAATDESRDVTWNERAQWIGLAFVPSGLLVAFSSYVTTDVASAPFIWVMPLAMFLATFIMVFRDRPMIPHQALLILQPVLVVLTLTGLGIPGSFGWMAATIAGIGGFLVTTLVAHRELYERRPEPRHLTEFYLWMSFGGVLGGVFAAIIAPQVFNVLFEFPLLLVLGMACRPGLGLALAKARDREGAALFAVGGVVAVLALADAVKLGLLGGELAMQSALIAILAAGVAMLLSRERPLRQLVGGALAGLCLLMLPTAMNQGTSERSFFGVHRIVVEPLVEPDGRVIGEARILLHGTTVHGIERTRDEAGQPIIGAPTPSSYYHPRSPMFHALQAARLAFVPREGHTFTTGIIGLGAGSMACHVKPGENWRLFEIDPVVVRIARTRFSFLQYCMPDADIVVGDARLTLAKEANATFDYLMIDAFSSDSIPVHLLTREALLLYLEKLGPNGVLALHISNLHLDLAGVTNALVASIPGLRAVNVFDRRKPSIDASPSVVVVLSRSAEALTPVLAWPGAAPAPATTATPWTDDYSNILAALLARYR